MANQKQDLIDILKGTQMRIDLVKEHTEQEAALQRVADMTSKDSKGKLDKVDQAFFDKQYARLKDFENYFQSAIFSGIDNEQLKADVRNFGYGFKYLAKAYNIELVITRKEQ